MRSKKRSGNARARSRYSSAIIGRWGLPWNLLSEQLRSKKEASRAQPSLSDVQWTIVLTAIISLASQNFARKTERSGDKRIQ